MMPLSNKMFQSMLFLGMLLFFYPDNSEAQHLRPRRSHAINRSATLQPNTPDTLTLVGVRVEFQQDDNRLTTGNGTFSEGNLSYLDAPEITIDPLPHDSTYFNSHLQFAKNYFEQVSGGQLTIKYRLLPNIYQLPNKMEAYSPTGRRFTNEKVAKLAQDTWATVDQKGGFTTAGLDPQKTAFIIFHAGVGRDIELTGTTLDKTPQDIPSLYLGQNALSDLLEQPQFNGFAINGGNFHVTNSLVLPRTLSRPGDNVSGEQYVLQLSLNGLLCASIGSYLGLPDLFNTQTGNSGIGRFGLMDGESFFSYRGLFPPEPSAWEKTFLDWQSPFRITTETAGLVSLPAASAHQTNSIARYSLSGDEYFLMENRHRDPQANGVRLTFRRPDGTTATKQFTNQDEAFVNQTEAFTKVLERGVVTDVSNFDWSLPGGLDLGADGTAGTSDDRPLNGGILIWHIDEAVISQQIGSHTVNANPKRRGVDLEEADGAQDIGRAASEDLNNQARGTAFDFWWAGNDASVVTLDGDTLSLYKNRFGPDTHPSNESNSGAPSFFELYDFSDTQPTATFRIRRRTAPNIVPVSLPVDSLSNRQTFTAAQADYFEAYPLGLSFYTSQADSFLVIPGQQSTYALNLGGGANPLFDFQSGLPQQPYLGNSLVIGQAPLKSSITLTDWQWDGSDWTTNWSQQARANSAFISSQDGQTLLLDFTDQQIDATNGSSLAPLPEPQQRSAPLEGQFSVLSSNTLRLQPANNSQTISGSGERHYTGSLQLTADRPAFYYLSDDRLTIYEPQDFDQPTTIVQNTPLGWPAMADLNQDGRLDFAYVNMRTHRLEARNLNGAMLAGFPIDPPEGAAFTGTPLITAGDNHQRTLFIPRQDSLSMNIAAYTADGNPVDGFPLYVGSISAESNQPIHPIINNKVLYAVSHRGEVKAWKLDNVIKVLWGGRYGTAPHNKVSGNLGDRNGPPATDPEQLLVKEETYNWPNPAKDFTNLRFQTRSAGSVGVKIIKPGGQVVLDRQYSSSGSAPEEHRISTQNWSNGLYFGMITAKSEGEQARKMIKIVVVH